MTSITRTSVQMENSDTFDIQYSLLPTPPYPTQVGHGPVLGVKSRETPCSRGDEMLRQSEWMCVYRSPPVGGSGSPLSPSQAVEQK